MVNKLQTSWLKLRENRRSGAASSRKIETPRSRSMTPSDETPPPIQKVVAIQGAAQEGDSVDQSPPKIIAKGSGALAEKLLDIAFAEGVKVRQDKDLTEILDAFDIESPVPLEALHAVSLILERVYAENNKMIDQQSTGVDAETPAKEDKPNG